MALEKQKILKSLTENLSKLNAFKDYNLDNDYVAIKAGKVYKVFGEEGKHLIVKEMQPFVNGGGYLEYVLTNKDKKKKHILGQIAICGCFQPKPKGKDFVNHRDGDTKNNKNSNLHWVDFSENMLHSYRVLNRKPTNQYIKAKENK
jgi:hypothetical protein